MWEIDHKHFCKFCSKYCLHVNNYKHGSSEKFELMSAKSNVLWIMLRNLSLNSLIINLWFFLLVSLYSLNHFKQRKCRKFFPELLTMGEWNESVCQYSVIVPAPGDDDRWVWGIGGMMIGRRTPNYSKKILLHCHCVHKCHMDCPRVVLKWNKSNVLGVCGFNVI